MPAVHIPLCRFISWLAIEEGRTTGRALDGRAFSVFGLGSSCYPRFCAAAGLLQSLLLSAGACRWRPFGCLHVIRRL